MGPICKQIQKVIKKRCFFPLNRVQGYRFSAPALSFGYSCKLQLQLPGSLQILIIPLQVIHRLELLEELYGTLVE